MPVLVGSGQGRYMTTVAQHLARLQREGRIVWSGKPFRPKRPVVRSRNGGVAEVLVRDRRSEP